ncbi:hypothetical protein LXT12_03200 [Pelomonas sp. P7]|uniref:Uncharacterized protein n=1 Tax=Pelomonas caseinilytica TaxID=2906763 RepID=A0ABS8XD06_9BURK|nr:hypothetical protein [Pelomonas sp. P7]MCE4536264.1 hypothetical protein [Pelomonas sp. P7]
MGAVVLVLAGSLAKLAQLWPGNPAAKGRVLWSNKKQGRRQQLVNGRFC